MTAEEGGGGLFIERLQEEQAEKQEMTQVKWWKALAGRQTTRGGGVCNGYTRLFYKAIPLATIVALMECEILNMAFWPRRLQTARCSAKTDSRA